MGTFFLCDTEGPLRSGTVDFELALSWTETFFLCDTRGMDGSFRGSGAVDVGDTCVYAGVGVPEACIGTCIGVGLARVEMGTVQFEGIGDASTPL